MTEVQVQNPPPDWSTLDKELHCPLCEYNLRGLAESRCPECGFAFTWAELLDALKNKHPYLFEYGRGRNVKTLCKTWWRTSQPRRFWREVNPAQDVKVRRLILYWVIASTLMLLLITVPYARAIWSVADQTYQIRSNFKPVPGRPGILRSFHGYMTASQLDDIYPPPWRSEFWEGVRGEIDQSSQYRDNYLAIASTCGIIYVAWPWFTLMSLLIFRISMRQAKIKTSHILRTIIYSCDFMTLMAAMGLGIYFTNAFDTRGWFYVAIAGVCAMITSYRLTIAFKEYLRVHRPFATVLVAQAISFLLAFILLIQIADFFHRI